MLAKAVQPDPTSQRLDLSTVGARVQITQVAGTEFYTWSGIQIVPSLT